MGASTSTYTDNYNYNHIERKSADGGKVDDFCTEINHYSVVHSSYLYLNNSTFISMFTSNCSFNALLRLSQFYDPDMDPTDNKILNKCVIVVSEKKIQGKG